MALSLDISPKNNTSTSNGFPYYIELITNDYYYRIECYDPEALMEFYSYRKPSGGSSELVRFYKEGWKSASITPIDESTYQPIDDNAYHRFKVYDENKSYLYTVTFKKTIVYRWLT